MTDCDFLVDVLKDGAWHSTAELLRYSIEERGCGLTVHSRVSDLRARGHNVEYRRVRGQRASAHQYRLIRALNESVGHSSPESSAGSLTATARRKGNSDALTAAPSYGPSDGPTGSAESASLAPGSPSTPGADPASQLLIWEAA